MAPAVKKGSAQNSSFEKYKNLIIDPKAIADKFGYWSTGSPKLDKLLGGGITKGRLSEFFGAPQSGKSTVALAVSRGVIAAGGRVLYIDLERGLEVKHLDQTSWLKTNGINPFDGTFDIIQSSSVAIPAEDVYNMMIGAVRDKEYQYIVVDSMAALVTRAELAGEIGDANMGSVARVNAQGLKTLFALQGSNQETSITCLNQVRDQLAGGMGGLKSTGGRALPHYTHQRLRFDKADQTKPQKDGDFLTPIRVRTFKSRGAPAFETELIISANRGVDVLSEVVEGATKAGYIVQKGAWFTLFEAPGSENIIFKGQGETSVRNYIEANRDWYDKLYEVTTSVADFIEVEGVEEV